MNKLESPAAMNTSRVREDWIPKEAYFSREFAELERELLWPKVWHLVCREEEVPNVGSFYTYDILDDSIIVMRTAPDTLKAFNNACLHRGRRLTQGCGRTNRLTCRFHGWKWNIDGTNHEVVDRDDWAGRLDDVNLDLPEFAIGTWGGFVFINMDPDCEPLDSYLKPMPAYLDAMEIDKQRVRWHITVEVEANWKTCQEAFAEAYHVATTHPQFEPLIDSRSFTVAHGRHSQLRFLPPDQQVVGYHRPQQGAHGDGRELAMQFMRMQVHDIQAIFSDRDLQAASRVLQLPEGTPYEVAMFKAGEYIREAAIAGGAGHPTMTMEQFMEAGFDWLIFPNIINVISQTGGLWYRALPSPDNNPDRCIFEMIALERMTPGSEPKVVKKHYKNWQDCDILPVFLIDDFINIPEVHRGLKTRGFQGARTNPIQEGMISNFHRVLHEYIYG